MFPDTRLVNRAVIGTEDVIRTCSRDQLVNFYNKWYRPERVAILAAGDVDPAVLEAAVREVFRAMKPRFRAPDLPADLLPPQASPGRAVVLSDPSSVGAVAVFQRPIPSTNVLETRELRVAVLSRNLAFAAFQRRLTKLADSGADDLVAPAVQMQDIMPGWQSAWFSAAGRLDRWDRLVRRMEQEHRRAMEFGFTRAEIEPVRRNFLESLDSGIRTVDTEHSRHTVARLVGAMLYGIPVVTPERLREELAETIQSLTPEQCHEAFRQAWGQDPLHVRLQSNDAVVISDSDLENILAGSRAVAVAAPTEIAAPEFAYQTFGRATEITEYRHDEGLDIHLARYGNGVRLNFKQTDFEQDTVSICVRIGGGGRLSLKKKQAGLDWFAAWSFVPGGLGRHSPTELGDILSGRTISGNFTSTNDAFLLTARCARRDLQLAFKVLAAHVVDPGYRQQAIPVAKSSFGSMISELVASPSGMIRVSMEHILFDGDPRFSVPVQESFGPASQAELKKWLEPHLRKGPMEISVVGDTRWEDVAGIVGRSFGALPQRSEKDPILKRPAFAKAPGKPFIFQSPPTLKQASLVFAYPTPECTGVSSIRRAHMLSAALEERVRQTLREELGSSYVFNASFENDDALEGLGRLVIRVDVNIDAIEPALERLRQELRHIAASGLTEDEFLRAKNPFVEGQRREMLTNDYWLYTVLTHAQGRPYKLEAARTRISEAESITRAELNALLTKYLRNDRVFEFIGLPAPQG